MLYLTFLGSLQKRLAPKTYFEIGVRRGASLRLAECPAIGVDPAYALEEEPREDTQLFMETSDNFFASGALEKALGSRQIDFSFIDGWHNAEFALRDFINTERYCAPGAAVVFDDVLPRTEDHAVREPHGRAWTGDVWKVATCLLKYRPDLKLTFADTNPTGLLVVQGLDPDNRILSDHYEEIERDMINPDGPLMPPEDYAGRFMAPAAALTQVTELAGDKAPDTAIKIDIANIVAVRFSLRLSDEWLSRAYGGGEEDRDAWIRMRAELFRNTVYRSIKAQSVAAKRILLLMDEGDRDAFEAYLSFDRDLITPVFVRGPAFGAALTKAVSEIATTNVAVSRIDSDDCVNTVYLEAVNDAIQRALTEERSFEFVVAPAGYRVSDKVVQPMFMGASAFLTQFTPEYQGENVYGFNHVEVCEHPHISTLRAKWIQMVHGSNVANEIFPKGLSPERFNSLMMTCLGQHKSLLGMQKPRKTGWPDNFVEIPLTSSAPERSDVA